MITSSRIIYRTSLSGFYFLCNWSWLKYTSIYRPCKLSSGGRTSHALRNMRPAGMTGRSQPIDNPSGETPKKQRGTGEPNVPRPSLLGGKFCFFMRRRKLILHRLDEHGIGHGPIAENDENGRHNALQR